MKSTARISHLVLANAVGIKIGDRERATSPISLRSPKRKFNELAYFDPKIAQRDYTTMAEADVGIVARNREATARYGWSPYMHDPKLKARLHRIRVPTLFLWGTSRPDRLGRPTAAPIAPQFRARASRRSSAPAISRISKRPKNSPATSSPSRKDGTRMRIYHFTEHPYPPRLG